MNPGGFARHLAITAWQDGAWADFPASVGVTNGTFVATDEEWQGRRHSAELALPPLGVCWLAPIR